MRYSRRMDCVSTSTGLRWTSRGFIPFLRTWRFCVWILPADWWAPIHEFDEGAFRMMRFALLMLSLAGFTATAMAAEGPAGDVFGGVSIDHTASDNSAVTFAGWQVNAAF